MLCEKCSQVRLPHKHEDAYKHFCLVKHHGTFDNLLASAQNGCELCQYYRPFIEQAKSRRQGLSSSLPPQYSFHEVFSNAPGDPFEDIPYGPTDNLIDGFTTTYGGSDATKFEVQSGIFYEYDDDKDKYRYFEADETWNARRIDEHWAQVERDDAQHDLEMGGKLAKLRLWDTHLPVYQATRCDEASENANVLAENTAKFEEIQWMLASKVHCDGPEQLWIRLSHCSETSSDLNMPANDDFYTLTLTAGSVELSSSLDNSPEICINGTTLSVYTLALVQPELWRYRADLLPIWEESQMQCLYPILEFYQRRDEPESVNPDVHSRDVAVDPGSSAVMDLARSWLDTCTKDHKLCELNGPLKLPRRLIDVGIDTNSSVKLHIVSSEHESLPYATLSHCWGQDTGSMTRLLEDNLLSMTQEINQDTLAQNFRDAIRITQGLNLRYLWIDALCIIQDSVEDWAAEAAMMGQYYRGAALTICAVSASHCQNGMLRLRSSVHTDLKLETSEGVFHLRPLLPNSVSVTDASTYSDLRKPIRMQPWNSRAWTLQERLFSRRIIYFTEEQMIWQCKSRFFAEDGQHSYVKKRADPQAIGRSLVDLVDYRPRVIGSSKKLAPPTVRSMQWFNLIERYTKRHLTFTKDRLPALSSLAREVHTHTKATYAAGVWVAHHSTTIIGLMWRPMTESYDGTNPREPKVSGNGSPSWSWASIEAEIEHPLADDDETVVRKQGLDPVIVSAKTKKATPDPFGAVTGGVLVVECWIHDYAGIRTFHKLCETAQVYDWAEQRELRSNDPDSPNADYFATFDISQPDDLWNVGKNDPPRLNQAFCIAFIAYTNQFEDGNNATKDHAKQYFLLLEKLSRHRYRRAGFAVTDSGTLFSIGDKHKWKRKRLTIV